MKLTMIGSHLCQDTIYALMKVKDLGAEVDFKDISISFPALKEFMKLREQSELYIEVKKNDGLGIPFFALEDGTQTLSLEEVLEHLRK